MKIIYLILNLIFGGVAVLCFHNYFSEESPKILKKSDVEKRANLNQVKAKIIMLPKTAIKDENVEEHNISVLLGSNLFEINRGVSPEETKNTASGASPSKENFILVGICNFGKLEGAIIVNRGGSASHSAIGRRGRGRVAQPAPVKAASDNKTFYKLGDDVGGGYKLTTVTKETVVLKNDTDEIVLTVAKTPSSIRSNATSNSEHINSGSNSTPAPEIEPTESDAIMRNSSMPMPPPPPGLNMPLNEELLRKEHPNLNIKMKRPLK